MRADLDRRRLAASALLAAALLVAGPAKAQSWLDRVLEFAGIAASPGAMKSDSDAPSAGDLWLVDLSGGSARQLTREGGYAWPIFMPDDGALLALRGPTLVQVPLDGGVPKALFEVPGIRKLIGFDRKGRDSALAVASDKEQPIRMLSLSRKTSEPLAYDGTDAAQRRMLRHLESQERVYGNVRVYARIDSREDLEGVRKWSEIYVSRDNAGPRKLTACGGDSCWQPSLSNAGRSVAYVRTQAP